MNNTVYRRRASTAPPAASARNRGAGLQWGRKGRLFPPRAPRVIAIAAMLAVPKRLPAARAAIPLFKDREPALFDLPGFVETVHGPEHPRQAPDVREAAPGGSAAERRSSPARFCSSARAGHAASHKAHVTAIAARKSPRSPIFRPLDNNVTEYRTSLAAGRHAGNFPAGGPRRSAEQKTFPQPWLHHFAELGSHNSRGRTVLPPASSIESVLCICYARGRCAFAAAMLSCARRPLEKHDE